MSIVMFYWLKEGNDEYIYDDRKHKIYNLIDNECSPVDCVSADVFLKFHPYLECIKSSEHCKLVEKA